ncbi:Bystin-domain-containing protein [Sistotremastrum niveocremeum HHB9708]|uniref:Bystin-domain-containing protein n=1 Tax=Sistotremastrum niveocremeum HHB9708 TaxID=1314777 RepID=A0A164ZI60_9AGAM|nr:Bystin-domain-containing protein [Sistotremastrum niveocremeum HHB9708]
MPRALKSKTKARSAPLPIQLHEDEVHAKYGKVSRPGKRRKSGQDSEESEEETLDPNVSQKILALAKSQQAELEGSEEDEEEVAEAKANLLKPRPVQNEDDSDDSDEWVEDDGDGPIDGEDYMENIHTEDLRTLDALLPANVGERRTLADIIFSKLDGNLDNAKGKQTIHIPAAAPDAKEGLDPRVVEAYTKIGVYMRKYKSGPFPKLFKILPSHPQWARLLSLTQPENWSPQATSKATRIFISNLKPEQSRVFLEGVLLDNVREDIRENGKLNVHYYEALKRSVFKPAAFFKGIIFPMVEGGCTLKEAAIIGSIITKMRIPMLHCAAALHQIASMDYSGPNSLFIRLLLDKKYALPFKVLDALFDHFVRLSNTYHGSRAKGEATKLPVLWHQSLLVYSQRYASDLTQDQKNALLDVIRVSQHPQISPEIRRELTQSVARGEPRPADGDVEMS